MIKNIFKILIAFTLTNSFVFGQDLNLVSGYQLKGAIDNIDPTKFNNSCAKYIFKYDNTTQSWKAHIANEEDYGYTGDTIEQLKRNDGFWVMGDAPCDIKINDKQDTILPDGTPYIITSDQLNVVENEKDIIFILSKGSNSASPNPYRYKISGGSEHRFFTIGNENGLLSFKEKPDFEDPLDSDKDNIYRVDIEVSDGTYSSEKSFFITVVDDTNDFFKIVSKPLLYASQNSNTYYVYDIKTLNAKGDVTCFDTTVTYPYYDDSYPGVTLDLDVSSNKINYKLFGADTYTYRKGGALTVNLSCKDESNTVVTQTYKINIIDNMSTVKLYPIVDEISMELRSNELVEIPFSGSHEGNSSVAINYEISTQPKNGTIVLKDDGKWWYRSNFNFIGDDSLEYKGRIVSDTTYISEPKIVNIKVLNSNHKPEVVDQNLTVDEETELIITLDGYDYEQDLLTYSIVNDSIKNGTLTKVDNTTYKYLPNKDFVGLESIAYTVNDGTSNSFEAHLNITVKNVNDKPVIKQVSHTISPKYLIKDTSMLLDTQSLIIRESTNTTDVEDDKLTFIVVASPKNGKLKIHEFGGYVYIPNHGYSGTDFFSYKAYDGKEYSDISTVNITIEPIENRASRKIPATGSKYSLNSLDDGSVQRGTPKSLTRDDAGFVVDNVTGLMWMDNGENLVDSTTLYEQTYAEDLPQSIKYDIKMVSYDEAESYCQSLSLGGYNDWRIPKRLEVSTIRDYGKEPEQAQYSSLMGVINWKSGNATVPDNSFKYASRPILKNYGLLIVYDERTFYIDAPDKNGTREVSLFSDSGIYGMNFDGDLVHKENHGFMCVRGSYTTDPVLFENKNEGVVLDTTTNQMWHNTVDITSRVQQYTEPTFDALSQRWAVPFTGNLDEVINHCSVSNVGGYSDWVLPNINEIKSLDSDLRFNSTLIFTDSLPYDRSSDVDKYLAATKLQHSKSYSSTLKKDQIAIYDKYKDISYDNNKTFVSGTYFPYFLDEKYSNIMTNAQETDDVIINGINYKPCLPFRTNTAANVAIYNGTEENAECSDAISKACLFDSSLYSECKVEPLEEFSKPQYSSKITQLGDTSGWSSSNLITRCVRKASTTDVTEFFNEIGEKELETAPVFKEFVFNEDENSFTNTLTNKTYTRLVDNNDGTLTDKMTGITILKNILDTVPKDINNLNTKYSLQEARDKVAQMNSENYLGGNWRLPIEKDIEFLKIVGNYSASYGSSSYLINHIDGDTSIASNFWLLRGNFFSANLGNILEPCIAETCTSDETIKREFIVVREDILGANIDRSIRHINEGEQFTLSSSNSYLGFNENISKVNYKWEELERYTPENNKLFSDAKIINPNSAQATITFPNVDKTYERRFQLTLTRDDSELISKDIINVFVRNKDLVKLAKDGTVLPYDSKDWSCIKDTNSSLIWESKDDNSTSDSFKDKLLTYDETVTLSSNSTLCGVSNWRLPTQQEFYKAKNNDELINYTGTGRSEKWGWQSTNEDRYWTTFDEVTIPMIDNDNNSVNDYVWTSSDGSYTPVARIQNKPLNKLEVLSEDNNTTLEMNPTYATTPRAEKHRFWLVAQE